MMKMRLLAGCGLLALTAGSNALATTLADVTGESGYSHLWNVNGATAPANYGTTIGLGAGGTGAQYHHIFTNVNLAPGGTTGSIVASDYAMFDPMTFSPNSYGVGQHSWCQSGDCTGIGEFESRGWNHTSNHVLFTLSADSNVTIDLSNAAGVDGLPGPNEEEGSLGGDLKPAFTLYSGASTTGINTFNHTFNNGVAAPSSPIWPGPEVTSLLFDANVANAASISWTGPLSAGLYSIWLGGNFANVANADGSHGKNYALSISAAAVPVPAAVWLFGNGVMGLLGWSRKRRR